VQPDASPVTQPSRTDKNHQTSAYYTRTDQICHPRTYDAPLRTWTGALAFFIFATLIVASAFITLYMLIAVLFILGQMVTP
jgi:hypothetical protein